MSRWLSLLRLLLALTLAMPIADAASAQNARDAEHRILVMLRAAPDHFRPDANYGSSYGDMTGRGARMRIARRVARDHGLRLIGDWPMPMLGIDCFVMTVPDARVPEDVAAQVSKDAGVAWSQPLNLFHGQAAAPVRPDPLQPAQPAERIWHIGALHHVATGKGVSVAIIDSRIDTAHPDLTGQVTTSRNFVDGHGGLAERHGTGVAGVIAAKAGNGVGISGVAPDARLLGLRACWETSGAAAEATVCDSLSLAKALHFALEHRAEVINLSLTGPRDLLLAKLIELGLANGAIIVAAVDRGERDGGFPACQPGVIAVSDQPVASLGAAVYVAPGRDIPTTGPGGKWLLVNGSSFAAAQVSGLAALAREQSPRKAPLIRRSAGGVVDACRTLSCQSLGLDRNCARLCGPVAD